jgi:hypothetical protein
MSASCPQLQDATVCILALSVMLIRDCSAQRGTHAINIFLRHPWETAASRIRVSDLCARNIDAPKRAAAR